MRLKVFACEVVARELYGCAARARHAVDIALLVQGFHDNSDTLRGRLQEMIDAAGPDRYDAVLLGYGLCNNALAGVRAGRVPLVVPRAHDCLTLLLGSKERYARLFAEQPGTYWFSSGWLECRDKRGVQIEPRPNSGLGPLYRGADYGALVEKYGEENAKYLVEFMSHWEDHYTRGVLIEFDFDRRLDLRERVRQICREKGWQFQTVPGDLSLVQAGLDGEWDDARFLVLQPGQAVRPCYDESIVAAAPDAPWRGDLPVAPVPGEARRGTDGTRTPPARCGDKECCG
jgi:hypothetical protein